MAPPFCITSNGAKRTRGFSWEVWRGDGDRGKREDKLTVLRLVARAMRSLVGIGNIPGGEGDNGGLVGAVDSVLDDVHNPIVVVRVDKHAPEHLGVLAVVVGELMTVGEAVRPLRVGRHGSQDDIDQLVQVRGDGDAARHGGSCVGEGCEWKICDAAGQGGREATEHGYWECCEELGSELGEGWKENGASKKETERTVTMDSGQQMTGCNAATGKGNAVMRMGWCSWQV